MKIVGYLSEENDKLYDVDTIRKLAGTTRSKIHRELKKNKDSGHIKYKNQYNKREFNCRGNKSNNSGNYATK